MCLICGVYFGQQRIGHSAVINLDGTFAVSGLQPGESDVSLSLTLTTPTGFSLIRIEGYATAQRNTIEIPSTGPLPPVKLVLGFGNCRIHGIRRSRRG